MKFSTIALAAMILMAGTANGKDQLFENDSAELGENEFRMEDYNLNDAQKKLMEEWKAKIPSIFDNKDYRLTWQQFWKAEEAQQKVKGLGELDLQIIKD